jgi:hypothetical protein
VSEYIRRVQQKDEVGEADSVPLFDEARVPVETIAVSNPHTQGPSGVAASTTGGSEVEIRSGEEVPLPQQHR